MVFLCIFHVRDTAAIRGQYLAMSKDWQSCCCDFCCWCCCFSKCCYLLYGIAGVQPGPVWSRCWHVVDERQICWLHLSHGMY